MLVNIVLCVLFFFYGKATCTNDSQFITVSLISLLVHRPSGDEVISLQNRLSIAQQQVSVLRQEKEDEHKAWQEKFNTTLKEVNRYEPYLR